MVPLSEYFCRRACGYNNADPHRKNKCAAIGETTRRDFMAFVMEEEAK